VRGLFTPEDSFSEDLCSERPASDHLDLEHVDLERADLERADSEHADSEGNRSKDIIQIIHLCLKDAKKHKNSRAIKTLTQLTAVPEYVKLCAWYQKYNVCKWPCLNASIAIAH
jgi:hypothetical protein